MDLHTEHTPLPTVTLSADRLRRVLKAPREVSMTIHGDDGKGSGGGNTGN
ncbi:hypothetical protein [Amycolatopsis keratiniphila]|nr:hypothetical protein [Amycolatopsis keratiniphila]